MDNKEKILNMIFAHPSRTFHIRELARELKLHPNTVVTLASELEKENLILKEKKLHVVEIKANEKNKKFVEKKRLSNLSRIYQSGIIDFLTLKYSPRCVIVMGSYSLGEDIERSDIDLVVITHRKENKNEDLSKYEKAFHRKIHLIITDYKDISHEFYTNLINGVVVHGYLEKK
ncbi:hypothetical protein COU57_02235 [Candidatus Pacearchaeota archaeon CG10_big_fil_rev_8_21_14_0_10_32_14]|nr:MAG: hypothetical protein COU57_02235 [Candidatus Pacearchaeota archaeon CG10_big_fil_rev_8_21_14_0_10_32_14]